MIQWKPQPAQYGGGDSTFGAEFAKGEPAIAKQLYNASGAFEDKKSCTVGAYSYKVKIVPKKDGSGNWIFIERKQTYVGLGDEKPEVTAAKSVEQEYANKQPNGFDQRQKDIAAAHADNVRMHNEAMEASKAQTEAMLVLANEVQGIKHLLEIAVNNSSMIKNAFKPASELNKKLPPEDARQ